MSSEVTKAGLVVSLGVQKLPSDYGMKSGKLYQTWGSDLLLSKYCGSPGIFSHQVCSMAKEDNFKEIVGISYAEMDHL